jgi:peroxiredoxin
MPAIEVGQQAPTFRLPAGQGGEIGLDDYVGRKPVIVWFTKGMGCSFCRQHMSQLARGYPTIRDRGAEVVEITPTPPERARFYAQHYRLPFPYLSDPEYAVHRAWGLDVQPNTLRYLVSAVLMGMRMPDPPSDLGPAKPTLRELPKVVQATDMGFFVVDRAGVVRFALSGSYMAPPAPGAGPTYAARPIPDQDEILEALEACAAN